MTRPSIRSAAWLLLPLLGACATTPAPLQGQFSVVSPNDIAADARTGDSVRWGGLVIEVEPQAERTCIEILARELSDSARPRERDVSDGRFLACRAGFYDPEVFTRGREVTVTGTVTALTQRPIGEYTYTMPEVAADVIYLWPERPQYEYIYAPYSPWLGPWPYSRWWYAPHYPTRHIHRPAPQRPMRDKRG